MKNLILVPLLLLSSLVLADYNTAVNSYSKKQYETAYNQFLAMAQTGEKQSQFNLGVMYYQGQYVKQDLNLAYAWIKLSTESETAKPSQLNVFEIIKNEITDLEQAEESYQIIASQFSTQVLISNLYPELVSLEGGNTFRAAVRNIVQPKYPRKAAMKRQQGWVRYKFDVDKLGVPRNIQLLESFPDDVFTQASRKVIPQWRFKPGVDKDGNPVAQKNLTYTMLFKFSKIDPLHLKKGVYEKQMKNALLGDPNAQYNIAFYEKKLNVSGGKENPNKWFLKAAMQGHPIAQYELGSSLVFGHGCKEDKAKGIEWLTRSAYNGQTDARQLLASEASKINTLESHQKAIDYITGIDDLSPSTKLNIAWMLAISPFEKIANPKQSLKIVSDMSWREFTDDITLSEIKAAAYAALGKFSKAIDLQEDALEEAEDRNADIDSIKEHLASYKKKEKWF